MSRDRLQEELNMDFSLDDILAEYRATADVSETVTSPAPAKAPKPLPAEPEEEDVRIYRPGKARAAEASRPLPENPPEAEEPPPEEKSGQRILAAARGLFDRVRGRKPAPAPLAPEDLPSFDDLVWGKKETPVRIMEEEEVPAPQAKASPPPPPLAPLKPEASVDPFTPSPEQMARAGVEDSLSASFSLEDILSDYRGGRPAARREIKPSVTEASPFSLEEILSDYRESSPAPSSPAASFPPSREKAAVSRRSAPPAVHTAPQAKEQPRPRGRENAPSPARERKTETKKDEDVEFGTMSLDHILAEYQDILAAMPSETPVAEQETDAPAAGQVSRMEREARNYIAQMKNEDFASIKEESAYDSLRPEPLPAAAPEKPYIPTADEEIDPRFRMDREQKSTMVFGDRELDLRADENYTPPKVAEGAGFHWTAGEEELPGKPVKKRPLFSGGKKLPAKERDTVHTEGYEENAGDAYAPAGDYGDDLDDEPDSAPFPSFGQYLSGLFSGLLVRLFGVKRSHDTSGTMEADEEDLGPEVKPSTASRYYGSFVLSLRLRLRIALVLLAVLAWISLGLPVSGALRTVEVASGMALAIQLVIMLLCLDVVTGAAVNLARGRFGADSLAVLCCVLTSFDALAVTLGVLGSPHMPLCLISSASLTCVLLSSLVSARALRKALRVPAIGKRCYTVSGETGVTGKGLTLLKSLRPPKGFVRRSEEAAPDETLFTRLSPLLLILSLLMTLIVGAFKHALSDFLFILTALLCPAVPLAALLAFALPYLFGSLRIFQSGAAIAGWSGLIDVGRSADLIVTDRDLFPEGSVEIDTVRIFADVQPETIISYAGTMICASGSDLAPCFAELMEKNGCPMRRVEGFEYLSGGGMKGVIDGSVVLCGGVDLMRLMNVRIPYRLVGKTTVLLSVDGILCGIFNMKYEGQPQVRKALVSLIRSNRHPIFAIRDFLVTPEMLSGCFDLATDGYDFPPYVDRFAISEAKPAETSKIAAVVCREGLGPLVHMADSGRSMYVATRVNLLLTALAAVLGVFVVFVRLLSIGTVGCGFLLLFMLLWALPVAVISVFQRI